VRAGRSRCTGVLRVEYRFDPAGECFLSPSIASVPGNVLGDARTDRFARENFVAIRRCEDERKAGILGTDGTQKTEAVDSGETVLAHYGVYLLARQTPETGFGARFSEQAPILTLEATKESRPVGTTRTDGLGDPNSCMEGDTAGTHIILTAGEVDS